MGLPANAAPPTDAEVAATLVDRKTWIFDINGDNRMVMLMSTDRWHQLLDPRTAG